MRKNKLSVSVSKSVRCHDDRTRLNWIGCIPVVTRMIVKEIIYE
jgi:hypothetical protein